MVDSSIDVKIFTAMKSAISIGEEVAQHIVTGLTIERQVEQESDGVDDTWQAALDASTERARLRTDETKSFWGGLFTSTSVVIIVAVIVAAIAAYYYMQSQSPGGAIKKFTGYGRR